MQELKSLEHDIRKNGFDYVLVIRDDKRAIYAQKKNSVIYAYEVFKVKVIKNTGYFSKDFNTYEKFPSNEDFGKIAWTTPYLSRAREIYHSL